MPAPQTAIVPDASPHARFLTLLVKDGEEWVEAARKACAAIPALTAEVAAIDPGAGLVSAVGVGSLCWDRLFPAAPRPRALKPFTARSHNGRHAPSTPADLFVHIHSGRHDLCFELARRVMKSFGDSVALVEDVSGFRYLDARDLTGFVDGTENPEGEERAEVALVADDQDPAFAAGSYVSIQRYIHDLSRWEQVPVDEQQRVIGRTKPDDQELQGDAKPPTAHISRVVIEEDGEELEILRHSMPYGDNREAGLYFVAYGSSPDNFDRMLARMVETDRHGHYDHLLDYTRAVTGASFFVPALDFLAAQ